MAATTGLSIRFADLDPLQSAILATVAYADVFDHAPTPAEIHRYLVGHAADLDTVWTALLQPPLAGSYVECREGCFFLAGREDLVPLRQRRARVARALWRPACHYAALIARLPFVRMVAVTGALAVDNVDENADIDYLIVTEAGRLWLCRALTIGLVRWAARRGHLVCPNYFLSENALAIPSHTLYTARELAQMVPLAGMSIYRRMRQLNAWTDDLLPNAQGIPRPLEPLPVVSLPGQSVAEGILRTPVGRWLETWEMERKVRKFRQQVNGTAPNEVAFCADWCKGHFDGHGRRTLEAFARRLERLSGIPSSERQQEAGTWDRDRPETCPYPVPLHLRSPKRGHGLTQMNTDFF